MERDTTKINKDLVLSELIITKGDRSKALKNVNVGRTQFYEWLKTDSEFKQKVEDTYKNTKTSGLLRQQKIVELDKLIENWSHKLRSMKDLRADEGDNWDDNHTQFFDSIIVDTATLIRYLKAQRDLNNG